MPLQASGEISISQINAEFGRGNDLNSYRGTTWYTSGGSSGTFSSGAIGMNEFYSKQATAPGGTFTPAGSTSSSSREYIEYTVDYTATYTVSCTQNATWTYSKSNSFGTQSVASGGTATSITFTVTSGLYGRGVVYTLDATSGSNTRYWTIYVYADNPDSGGCPFCCFTPDTLILMGDGSLRAIGEVQVGDFILTYSEELKTNVAVPVTEVIVRTDRPMYQYTFEDGSTLKASEEHPLYILGKGYASLVPVPEYKDMGLAKVVELGDSAVNELGSPKKIEKIERISYAGAVYTFGNTRFYANGILVY